MAGRRRRRHALGRTAVSSRGRRRIEGSAAGRPSPTIDPVPTVAAIEIGQSPRPDLVGGLNAVLPDDAGLFEVGALDGIDPATVPPIRFDAENPLSTRLADGQQIIVDEPWIAPHVQ